MNQEFEMMTDLNVNARPWTPQQQQFPSFQQIAQLEQLRQQQLQQFQQLQQLQLLQQFQQQQYVYNQTRIIPRSSSSFNPQQLSHQQQYPLPQYYLGSYDPNFKLTRSQYGNPTIPLQVVVPSNEWQGAA